MYIAPRNSCSCPTRELNAMQLLMFVGGSCTTLTCSPFSLNSITLLQSQIISIFFSIFSLSFPSQKSKKNLPIYFKSIIVVPFIFHYILNHLPG